MSKRDYYRTLGVNKSANADEMKKAYRSLAFKYHPDKNPGDKAAEEKFKEVTEAYEVLSDSQKKAQYDQFGYDAFKYAGAGAGASADAGTYGFESVDLNEALRAFSEAFGGGGGESSFGDFFGLGNIFGSGGEARTRKGRSVELSMEIPFEDAAFGTKRTVRISRFENCDVCDGSGAKPGTSKTRCKQCQGSGKVSTSTGFFSISRTCPHCQGEGEIIKTPCKKCRGDSRVKFDRKIEVKIPAGIDSQTRLRISGEGEAPRGGGIRGDLYVLIYVKKHDIFQRDGNDIICRVPVTFSQAALGDEIDIPTLEGKVKMKVPSGTQSGKVFRLRGKGITDINGYGRGDELVQVLVETPVKLNARQKQLLEEFAQVGNGASPGVKTFIVKMKKMFK